MKISMRTEKTRRSFSRSDVQIQNNLPLTLKVPNKTQFQSESKKVLLAILKLETEDDYIEVNILTTYEDGLLNQTV